MSNKDIKRTEMVARSKNKVLSCSTPEHNLDSPSRDNDSIYDSDSASPVPFQCTQDGTEGETDVVWNFYSPKTQSDFKNTTPVSRKSNKSQRRKHIEKPIPKRRPVKPSQKKIELLQELIELNHNLPKFVKKTTTTSLEKPQADEDIFSDGNDSSPRSCTKNKNRCLRKNVLSSKFVKTESESGLESDDSMNECLLKASQAVEENISNYEPLQAKRPCIEPITRQSLKPNLRINIDQDSMDAILSNIKIESPNINKAKKCDTDRFNNDSFDNLLVNLNDSALEWLSQIPKEIERSVRTTSGVMDMNWSFKDSIIGDGSPSSKTIFGRHSSMPESPSVNETNKPSTSGMVFGRHSSMPFNKSSDKIVPEDSPIRCTPEEIKKKHQQAREKLLAKRALPFTTTPQINPTKPSHKFVPKKPIFQPKQPMIIKQVDIKKNEETDKSNTDNIKLLIEKKRQEALMKLRRRHPQN